MKRLIDIQCGGADCDYSEIDVWKEIGEYGKCHKCGEPMVRWHQMKSAKVIGDDIPGGVWMPHGICWPDGSPRKYYSHSEMRKEAKRLGWENNVRHLPDRGKDTSKHTTRWI